MTKGSNFWVIGGEFGSMNFHKLVEGSAQVQGPFKSRKEAEDAWRVVSEENRHRAGVRFSIVEEPSPPWGPFSDGERANPQGELPHRLKKNRQGNGRPLPKRWGGAFFFLG